MSRFEERQLVGEVDRSFIEVGSLEDRAGDRSYWMSRTPDERIRALELLRQMLYGYDPSTARLQRVLESAERNMKWTIC